MRLGIIGAGSIGEKHAEVADSAGYSITQVIDNQEERAKELATKYSAVHGADVKVLWDNSDVDAVVIGVPNCFHKSLAIEAMEAGKDVLLEKPMACNVAECDEIIAVAEKTKRMVQIGFMHRYTAVGQAAKRIVDSGKLGNIYHAKAHLLRKRGVPGLGTWFTTKKMSSGGCLIDIGVHVLDLLLYLQGHPKISYLAGKTYAEFGSKMQDYVYQSMWAGPPNYDGVCDVEDSAHAFILLEGGTSIDLQVSWAGNFPANNMPESTIGLFGDQGGISFELDGDHVKLASDEFGYNSDANILLPEVNSMAEQMNDFANVISVRKAGIGATPSQGRQVQSIIDAIYASSESNSAITL